MTKDYRSPLSLDEQRFRSEHCWELDCDIDPLILRARLLHRQGQSLLALAMEQELLPIL
ncbi:MAG: hypothetical protein AB8A46_04185 [Prochlorococcus sp.]|jgi:hypothetical protein|nr:hypothetical protein [Prochlorococcaceae cyanobacterium ETNP18_MAG_1]CAI8157824.1 MAG: Uncharacterised protein [Prochlorococcus marinus str. MIT 9215]